ncbi:MAG: hypothetical protein GKR88_13860 [Flavobacteriaceae bacterium]|nr:MAG: hypothetical protein GKR88_13860 [Flavobacteriaceae bacterium]
MFIIGKKFITSLLLLIVFLSPLSLQFNTTTNTNAELPTISIVENSAHALSVPCEDGWFNFIDTAACGIGNFVLTYFELIWFYTTQILVVLVGLMFDAFLFFSIDSQFYRTGMIEAGWEILRDFTNIAFIFALLVQAFQMVLGVNISKARNKLVKVILVALVVNFSLFVSYAIIDSSNILAHVFYNKIDASQAQDYNSQIQDGVEVEGTTISESGSDVVDITKQFLEGVGADTRSVSLAIAGNINPQKIINSTPNNNQNGTFSFGQAFIIVTMSGLMNILLIYLFGSIMFLFVGRTLALIMYAILGPVAFVSILIPGLENNKYIGLGNWFKQMFSLAFMAPIFLFFMYIVVTFINNKAILGSLNSGNQSFFGGIMSVFMLFFMIGGLLYFSKKIAKDMAGELGGMLSKAVMGSVGAVVAVGAVAATGGAAAVGMGARAAGGVASMAGKKGAAKSLSSFGKRAMSLKADITKLPGFKTVVGKKATNMIGKVTGRSALGHIDHAKKKSGLKTAFGSEYDKLTSDKENKELKDANDAAKAAQRKAEAKHESELYQKRFDAELARKKRNEKKDGFIDNDGKNGGYKEAKSQSDNENKTLGDLNKTLKGLQKERKDLGDRSSGFNSDNSKHDEKDKQIKEIEAKITVSQNSKQSADTYIQNISTDYNNKQAAANQKRAEQKSAGEAAANESRATSAAKASTADVTDKILKGQKAKGGKIEDVLKKAIKEGDLVLDDENDGK